MEYYMKILTLLTSLAITPIALAHADHEPEHPSDHPEHPESGAQSDAAEQAEGILKKVHKAYSGATAITESIAVTFPSMMPGQDPETVTLNIAINANSGQVTVEDEMNAVWKGGKVYITLDDNSDVYVETEAKTFSAGLDAATGGQGMPMWTLKLRESDNAEDWFDAFSMGMPGAEIVSVTEDSGANIIEMKTMMGSLKIYISAENTVDKVIMLFEQPGMPAMEMSAVADIKFIKTIPAVSFDAGDRKKYDSVDAIMDEMYGGDDDGGSEADLIGKPAPDFTLAALDGSGNVTLSNLEGNIVILDFWATWCGPCKLGLPLLNEFDAWAQKEGLNVKVFALNVWEDGDAEAVKKTVSTFWKDNKYATAVLLGSGDDAISKSYGVKGIPATFVIGPDGTVLESHIGYDKNMVEVLKKSVDGALSGDKKKPDHPDHPGN